MTNSRGWKCGVYVLIIVHFARFILLSMDQLSLSTYRENVIGLQDLALQIPVMEVIVWIEQTRKTRSVSVKLHPFDKWVELEKAPVSSYCFFKTENSELARPVYIKIVQCVYN
ncbi:hypothetical protein BC943DRAFT_315913 [Umbelopsis sp. AD052]|nr:hypothetical protein BC943DRAFT_315913 [Umbelopsis sp. AD052]